MRGQGIGKRLVGELVEEAERQGFERIWLETLGILTTAAQIYAPTASSWSTSGSARPGAIPTSRTAATS